MKAGAFRVGDCVKVERDEAVRPPRGAWKALRGRPGKVASVSRGENEVLVQLRGLGTPKWFRPDELRRTRKVAS